LPYGDDMRTMLLGFCLVTGFSTLSASIIVTVEAPGVQATTIPGTITEDFNSLTPGPLGVFVSPIGTYSSGAEIVAANAFGGADQTNYIAVGAQSGTTSYTLTFDDPQSYFGLYWSAGDANNVLEFFDGGTMVGDFNTATALGPLSSAYLGNPNNGDDSGEKFAFLNFNSTSPSTDFTSVEFINDSFGTGFESDNQTIPAPTPEPSEYGFLFGGVALIGLLIRRRSVVR
jgi:hypothetical protein